MILRGCGGWILGGRGGPTSVHPQLPVCLPVHLTARNCVPACGEMGAAGAHGRWGCGGVGVARAGGWPRSYVGLGLPTHLPARLLLEPPPHPAIWRYLHAQLSTHLRARRGTLCAHRCCHLCARRHLSFWSRGRPPAPKRKATGSIPIGNIFVCNQNFDFCFGIQIPPLCKILTNLIFFEKIKCAKSVQTENLK